MSYHLSQDQFEACVLRRTGQAELEHIRDCPECRAEFDHFNKVLSLFRSAVRDRVDDRIAREASNRATRPPAADTIPKWRWGFVAAVFVTVVVIPFFLPENTTPEPAEQVSAEMSPEAVMERLNRHVSRTVPAPMEPAMSLIPREQLASKAGGFQ